MKRPADGAVQIRGPRLRSDHGGGDLGAGRPPDVGVGGDLGRPRSAPKVAFTAIVYTGVIGILQLIAQAIVVSVKGAEQVALEGGPPTFGLALFLEREECQRSSTACSRT